MLLDELGKVVETRRCAKGSWISINIEKVARRMCASNKDIPMASVRKQKPTMEPIMPTNGRIHMLNI